MPLEGGGAGPEDIAIDRASGIAYISATDRWAVFGKKNPQNPDALNRPGRLYALPLDVTPLQTREITPADFQDRPNDRRTDFQPHGISLIDTKDGKLLFVINHLRTWSGDGWDDPIKNRIDIVKVAGTARAMLMRSISETPPVDSKPLLVSPNDIAALDENRFFVTNEHGGEAVFWALLGDMFRINHGTLLFYDGSKFHKLRDIPMANGVAVAQKAGENRLYVTSSMTGQVMEFTWSREPTALTLVKSTSTGTGLDNIDVGPDSAPYVAGHPQPLRLILYRLGWAKSSPSQVVRLGGANGDRMIYEDPDGAAASVAAVYKNKILLGSIFDDKVKVCDLKG